MTGGDRDRLAAMVAASKPLYAQAEAFRPLLAPDSDPFEAELLAERLIDRYTESALGGVLDLAMGLIPLAARYREPQVAALVCAVDHLMGGMASAMALSDLRTAGVPDPPWQDRLDALTPVRAWRYQDVFAERQVFVVTFRRPGTAGEHAVLVETLPTPHPAIVRTDMARLHEELRDRLAEQSPDLVAEEITLEGAGAALTPLARRRHAAADRASLAHLRLVGDRIARLPMPEPEDGIAGGPPSDTEQVPEQLAFLPEPDPVPSAPVPVAREASVEAFMAATPTPSGTDREVLRFWARVLAGHNAVTDEAPTRIGPVRLGIVLGEYVPRTFELSPQQREGLRASVTTWATWAAHRQGLPDSAVEQLTARVEELDQAFDHAYDDPHLAPVRCYLSDVAGTVTDGRELERLRAVRSHAVPPPHDRPEQTRALVAADPGQRRRVLAAELDSWTNEGWDPAPELSAEERLDALADLAEELWTGQPPDLTRMVADHAAVAGFDTDLLGDLFVLAVEHRDDRPGFLAQAEERLSVDIYPDA